MFTIVALWGFRCLAVWAIVTGICGTFGVGHPVLSVLLSILLVITGILIGLGK
jgi:hypothetical protein